MYHIYIYIVYGSFHSPGTLVRPPCRFGDFDSTHMLRVGGGRFVASQAVHQFDEQSVNKKRCTAWSNCTDGFSAKKATVSASKPPCKAVARK